MPKRSAEHKLQKYKRKIKRLERKQLRIISESSDSENIEGHDEGEGIEMALKVPTEIPLPMDPDQVPNIEEVPDLAPPPVQLEAVPVAPEILHDVEATSQADVPAIDPELLSALGESTDDSPEFGEKILDNLAKLWLPLLKKGLPKEIKDKLLKEYIIPDNCRLLQAPKLNAEISAAIPDMVRHRDKSLTYYQQQLGCGITAVNRAMEMLLKGDDKVHALKHLSNSCRIMSDLHFMSTKNRIKLILPSLDKTFLHVVQEAERDETIFGNTLGEKIKAAKAIEKQGLQIKRNVNPKPVASQQPTSSRSTYSGNWSAPPRFSSNRGGRGTRKMPPNTRRPYTAPSTNKSSAQHKPRAPPAQ